MAQPIEPNLTWKSGSAKNAADVSGTLAVAENLLKQHEHEAARKELKGWLAANPTDQRAIDLLMQVERQAFEHRQATGQEKHKPSRNLWSNPPVPMGELWEVVAVGLWAFVNVFITFSEWLGRGKRKPTAP